MNHLHAAQVRQLGIETSETFARTMLSWDTGRGPTAEALERSDNDHWFDQTEVSW
ncbi:hypothetical protein [Variovorax paradoxus]|uniref:hypothetical protein n=1 Tax=Variovorax paradoxus TaxID=34073 RepID=UPI0030D5F59B